MNNQGLRSQLLLACREMGATGLSVGTSGNLSARVAEDRFLTTPSALAYEAMAPADLVLVTLDGTVVDGARKPSSEWPFHAAVYKARAEASAIAHVHSAYATALSCKREGIPAFHYMVGIAGGPDIPCCGYALPGSQELADNVVTGLTGRRACLMANHGQIAFADTPAKAVALAREVETLAQHYTLARQNGDPVLLTDAEMAEVMKLFEKYGK